MNEKEIEALKEWYVVSKQLIENYKRENEILITELQTIKLIKKDEKKGRRKMRFFHC